MSNHPLSLCPKCGCREFELVESPGQSKSALVMCCNNCGCVIGAQMDNNPCETDDIVAKYEKYLGIGFKVVSMN